MAARFQLVLCFACCCAALPLSGQVEMKLTLQADGFYSVSLLPDSSFASAEIADVRTTIKVPTGFFKTHELTNLQSGLLVFGATMRFDSPFEQPGFDYLVFHLKPFAGNAVPASPGVEIPLLKFANGGSCQGDSIFLMREDDLFRQPNSIDAQVGQQVLLTSGETLEISLKNEAVAACTGCLFTADLLKIDSVQTANPVACLGGNNGMLRIFAHGANALEFSLDSGQTWSTADHFGDLAAGIFHPAVRGVYFGCPVGAFGEGVKLVADTRITVLLDAPAKVCAGGDFSLKIISPQPLPPTSELAWTGPLGFTSTISEPVIFDAISYQSGTYRLTLTAPGCDPALASTTVQIIEPPAPPAFLSNAPVCHGDKLQLSTPAAAEKYEWLSPLGSSPATLAMAGLTTSTGETFLAANHPAYLSGNWKVRTTDANGCASESQPFEIKIKPRPQAYAVNDSPVCAGGAVQLSANQVPGAIYRWRKEGQPGIFSLQQSPVVTNLASEQTFELELILDGCTSQMPAQTTATLHPQPVVNPSHIYSQNADCSPADLQLFANGNPNGLAATYDWSGANGFFSQVENPILPDANPASNGSYLVKITDANGCSAAKAFQVTNVAGALASPVIQSTGSVCPGGGVQLSAQALPQNLATANFQWLKNGAPLAGATSNQLNFNAVQANDEGTYRLRMQVQACTLFSNSLPLDLLDSPTAAPDFSLSNPCEGGTLQFFSQTAGNVAWHWTGPNAFASDAPNPLIYNAVFGDIGAYSLTVTGSNGCTKTESIVVDGILPVPDAPLVVSNSPVCPEDQIVLTVQNPGLIGDVFFEWRNGLGEVLPAFGSSVTLAASDPQAVPPFVVKTNVNTCESALSEPVPVQVKPMPVASAGNAGAVCPGSPAQLFAAPQAGSSYEWSLVGAPQVVSFDQNPSLPVQDTTLFQLIVKTAGCDAADTATTLVLTLPEPEITYLAGGGSFCEGASTTLAGAANAGAAGGGGNLQFIWSGAGGFTFPGTAQAQDTFLLSLQNLEIQQEGTYSLQISNAWGCVSQPQSLVLDLSVSPSPPMLSAQSQAICQGETLQLDATPLPGSNVQYEWFFNDGSTNQSLGVTASPTFLLTNTSPSNSGIYSVTANASGCLSPPSNLVPVAVTGAPGSLAVGNSTSAAEPACEGKPVQFLAPLIPGATYAWQGPAGFQSNVSNPLISNAQVQQAGEYLAVVTLPGCSVPLYATTTVFVHPTPSTPALVGELQVCEGSDAVIFVANPQMGVSYEFYFGQGSQPVQTGTASELLLENVSMTQAGNYHAVAVANGCASLISAPAELVINSLQSAIAFAGNDRTLCGGMSETVLQAALPTAGSGQWLSLDGAVVLQPLQANAQAINLQSGENRFVWAVSGGVCQPFSSDTMTVWVENFEAMPDQLLVLQNDTLLDINLLENDFFANTAALEFLILQKPGKGELLEAAEGKISYLPFPNAFGFDQFSYLLCSMNCPDVCDSALVSVLIEGGSGEAADCFIPNLISPNGDGENDEFVVPCVFDFSGSELAVFNRWGAPVFQAKNYANDWGGTYNGQPLPVGTYFYQLKLNDGRGTVRQGYVAVMR